MEAAREHLIFPLDVSGKAAALNYVRLLHAEVGLFKVGLELYLAQKPKEPGLLNELVKYIDPGRIFLDLKFYDIPSTVLGAIKTIATGLALITVPSDLGPMGLKKIVEGTAFHVLAVTFLTSSTAEDLRDLGYAPRFYKDPTKLVVKRAKLSQKAGCAGVVCSGREVQAVKEACGSDFLVVCPGIRPQWSLVPGDDQQRIVTPYQAIKDGADYVVVGRPIRNYPETDGGPVAAARRVVEEIAVGLKDRHGP